jgi:hypothetical protein
MDAERLLASQDDAVGVDFQVSAIDPIREVAIIEYELAPQGIYGYLVQESAFIDSPFNLQYSATGHGRDPNQGISAVVRAASNEYLGGFSSAVNLYPCVAIDKAVGETRGSSTYPNDAYCFTVLINSWVEGENPGDGNYAVPSMLRQYGSGIDGYVITFERVPYSIQSAETACKNPDTEEALPCTSFDTTVSGAKAACYDDPCTIQNDLEMGNSQIRGIIQRSAVVIAFSYIVLGMIALAAVCAVAMTIAVATRSRPPALEGLAFMAALLFAVQPLRGALPDAPPVGMDADVLLFYPCVLLILVSLALQVAFWVRRDDYRA